MRIIITGTPGTGKSYLATRLGKKFDHAVIDTTALIKKKKLYDSYDAESETYEVSIVTLNKELKKILERRKNVILDGHLTHYLPKKYVDLCIVTRCPIEVLHKRLKKRNYSAEKIKENIDAEIFEVILGEAQARNYPILVVDTSEKLDLGRIAAKASIT